MFISRHFESVRTNFLSGAVGLSSIIDDGPHQLRVVVVAAPHHGWSAVIRKQLSGNAPDRRISGNLSYMKRVAEEVPSPFAWLAAEKSRTR